MLPYTGGDLTRPGMPNKVAQEQTRWPMLRLQKDVCLQGSPMKLLRWVQLSDVSRLHPGRPDGACIVLPTCYVATCHRLLMERFFYPRPEGPERAAADA